MNTQLLPVHCGPSLLPRILRVNCIPLNPDLYSAEHFLGSGAEHPVVYAMPDVCRVYNKTCKIPKPILKRIQICICFLFLYHQLNPYSDKTQLLPWPKVIHSLENKMNTNVPMKLCSSITRPNPPKEGARLPRINFQKAKKKNSGFFKGAVLYPTLKVMLRQWLQ